MILNQANLMIIGANMFLSFLDFAIFYYFCKNIKQRKIELFSWGYPVVLEINKLIIKLPVFGWGILYGVLVGLLRIFGGPAYPLLTILMSLVTVKFLTRRSLADTILILALSFFFGLIIQMPIALLMLVLPIPKMTMALIGQSLTVIFVAIVCYKMPIFKTFNYLKMNIILKMVLFLGAIVTSGFIFFLNFENDLMFIMSFLTLIVLFLFALIPLWKRLYKWLEVDVNRSHFITNKILAAHYTVQITDDIAVIRQELDALLAHVSPKTYVAPAVTDNIEETVLSFIEDKKKQHQAKVDIVTKVNHNVDYKDVKPGTMLTFLGLLLDNAFEVETNQPVLVHYGSDYPSCHLTVSNEYLNISDAQLDQMFEKEYSTQVKDDRGYGLYKLKQEVEALGLKIDCFEIYKEAYETYYITFVI